MEEVTARRRAVAEENRLEALGYYDKGLSVKEILEKMKPKVTSIQAIYKYLGDSGTNLRKAEVEMLVCTLWKKNKTPKEMPPIIKEKLGTSVGIGVIYKYLSLNGLNKAQKVRDRTLAIVKYRRDGKTYEWICEKLEVSLSQARADFANRKKYTA